LERYGRLQLIGSAAHHPQVQYKWQKLLSERPKIVHPKPHLTPHLVTPKNIATKRGEDLSG